MDLYKYYLLEIMPDSLFFESKYGFLHYTLQENLIWIEAFYILPEHRKGDYYKMMLNGMIANHNDITHLGCKVDLHCKDPNKRVRSYMRYGFEIQSITGNSIIMLKKI